METENQNQQSNPSVIPPVPQTSMPNEKLKSKLPVILVVLLILLFVGSGAYYLGSQKNNSNQANQYVQQPSPTSSENQPTSVPADSPTPPTSIPATWKTFTSKTEGFTIRYPDNWIIQDTSSGNCGHTSGTSTPNGFCRDRFDFISPDGLIVRYVIHKDENNDRISCGTQSSCDNQNVQSLDTLNVGSLGQVLLIKQDKEVNLHKPLDSGTTPVVGANKHSNYMIDFSLPSTTGGRFALFVTMPNPNTKFDKLTSEQFYSSDSVKQAIQILQSLHY